MKGRIVTLNTQISDKIQIMRVVRAVYCDGGCYGKTSKREKGKSKED